MSKAEAKVHELVAMIERGELQLPEMQRRYVWRSTRVRDLLDSLYRGWPSGAILVWETDAEVPLQDFAVTQSANPYATSRLLLDGQQRLTSLSAVIRGEPVTVRGRQRPIEILPPGHIGGTSARELPGSAENRRGLRTRSGGLPSATTEVRDARTQDPAYRPTPVVWPRCGPGGGSTRP